MIHYVAGLAMHGEKLVLIRKNRPDWQAGRLNGVGGLIEPGENGREAMHREFREEAGCEAEWTHFCTMAGASETWAVLWFAGYTRGEPKTMTDEEIVLVSPGFLPHDVIPNLRFLVPMSLMSRKDWPYFVTEPNT